MTGTNVACAECPAFRLNSERDAGSIGLCEQSGAGIGRLSGSSSERARVGALVSRFLGLARAVAVPMFTAAMAADVELRRPLFLE
eukprot:3006345-Pleurochrysis_carterae.AAC.1